MPEQPGSIGTSSRPIDMVAAALIVNTSVDTLPGNVAKAALAENGDIQFLSDYDDFSNEELVAQISGSQKTILGGEAVVSGSTESLIRWHIGNGFLVGIQSSNGPVGEGEDLTVDAQIKNVGGSSATKDVALNVANAERDRKSVSLNKAASTTVSLTWSTQNGDAGEYTATVSTPDDTATTQVKIVNWDLIADFEDGTLDATNPDWGSWDGPDLVSIDNPGIVGTYEATMETDSRDFRLDETASRSPVDSSLTAFKMIVQPRPNSPDSSSYLDVRLHGDAGGMLRVQWTQASDTLINGTVVGSFDQNNPNQHLRFWFDFGAGDCKVVINGTDYGRFAFGGSDTAVEQIEFGAHDKVDDLGTKISWDELYEAD